GFDCRRYVFGKGEDGTDAAVENLYARLGTEEPNFCFAGHTDVVPVGDEGAWQSDPFEARIDNGELIGRGAADMKSAIAAFVTAVERHIKHAGLPKGSISLLITGDEEGPAVNGTKALLQAITNEGEVLDHCLVGEPTNPMQLGEMIKIGRRGSLNGVITVKGTQGHVAYPHLADNPVPKLVQLLAALGALELDEGNDHFQPSNLEITSIDVGNTATNVIPARAVARFNVRFNSEETGERLIRRISEALDRAGVPYELDTHISGEAFFTPPGRLSDIVQQAIEDELGMTAELSTTGGTSDARFIKDYCPVVEFGLIGQTMHKVDERVAVQDIEALSRIYERVLDAYFASS
ncbi:MAG: succinyl-diaminopimelate desuccinylase, partial [Alphaproteobacteria bacterium]|nr:succinyl-diaminopimelate desuccinylase [Alphaproteobacteria bacterium]